MVRATLLCCFTVLPLVVQAATPEIRVSNEIVPPGGMAQIKVSLTSPKPIITGNMYADLSADFIDSIDGIQMFSPAGDVMGTAVVKGGTVAARFVSPNGTFGSLTDYPILTIAVSISKFAIPGQKITVALDPKASFWQDLLGPVAVSLVPGSITVGGSLSVTNVLPGGGIIPAGGSFSVTGFGFTPKTKLSVRGVNAQTIQYVSPTQFLVTVRQTSQLDGALIQAQNPDNITDNYYSYLRAIPMGASAQPLLAATVPVFSILTATDAVLPSTISPLLNPDYFTGIALENPTAAPASVVMEARSAANDLLGSTSVSIPTGARHSREASELFGFVLPTGAYIHVQSSQPVRVVGILGNGNTGVVLPLAPTIVAGPPLLNGGAGK